MAFNPNMQNGNPKIFKLDNLLLSTNYGNKNEVRRSCEELLRSYEGLDSFNIPNPDKNPVRVIEIYGTIPVNFKGRFYHVIVSLIFTPLFPNVPPLVHFVNPDAKKYMALQKYDSKKTLFPNGKYYYPLYLSEIQSWMSHRSVLKIVRQCVTEFGNEYPLYECNSNNNPNLFKSGVNNSIQQSGIFQQNQPNPQNVNTMLNTGNMYNAGGMNNNMNQGGFGMPNMNQGGFGMNNNMNMGGGGMMNMNPTVSKEQLLVPLKKRYNEEALQIARKLEKDLNLQRNNMVEIQNLYLKITEEEEKLQKFENNAPMVISDLEDKIKGLDQIISQHQSTVLNVETLKTTIEEDDQASKMLFDLITTNKSIEDLNLVLEELFNSGRLDLESYLKIYKENTEREFLNNVIMKKIITAQQA